MYFIFRLEILFHDDHFAYQSGATRFSAFSLWFNDSQSPSNRTPSPRVGSRNALCYPKSCLSCDQPRIPFFGEHNTVRMFITLAHLKGCRNQQVRRTVQERQPRDVDFYLLGTLLYGTLGRYKHIF